MTNNCKKLNLLKENIKTFVDFPKKGIVFRDIFSALLKYESFKALHDLLLEHIKSLDTKIDAVIGLEARGFLLGPLIALECQVPFVPIRKEGKLPGPIISHEYKLEYNIDVFEIQKDSVSPGSAVIIIDDLLATGGSMKAAIDLLASLKVTVIECLVVMELTELKGRERLQSPVHSLIKYN